MIAAAKARRQHVKLRRVGPACAGLDVTHTDGPHPAFGGAARELRAYWTGDGQIMEG